MWIVFHNLKKQKILLVQFGIDTNLKMEGKKRKKQTPPPAPGLVSESVSPPEKQYKNHHLYEQFVYQQREAV